MSTRMANDAKLPSKKLKFPYSLGPRVRAISNPLIKERPRRRMFVANVVRNLTLILVRFKISGSPPYS